MPLADGQMQVRDLVMGEGTNYNVLTGTNFFTRDADAAQSGPRAWDHGSWAGAEFQAEAVIPIRVSITAVDEKAWLPLRHKLAAAFRPIGSSVKDVELRFTYGGEEFLLFGRPRRFDPDTDLTVAGYSVVRLGIVCPDPKIYSATETLVGPISLPTFSGGLTVPFTVPFSIDVTRLGGGADLASDGTAEAGLLLQLDGPLTSPVLSLTSGGVTQTLRADVNLTAGQRLEIDTKRRSARIGESVYRNKISGDWFRLPEGPATSRLEFRASGGTGTCTVRYRHTWW